MRSFGFLTVLVTAALTLASPLAVRDGSQVEYDLAQLITPEVTQLTTDLKAFPESGLDGALVRCLFHHQIHG